MFMLWHSRWYASKTISTIRYIHIHKSQVIIFIPKALLWISILYTVSYSNFCELEIIQAGSGCYLQMLKNE
jgi:hypothetical protein